MGKKEPMDLPQPFTGSSINSKYNYIQNDNINARFRNKFKEPNFIDVLLYSPRNLITTPFESYHQRQYCHLATEKNG